MPKPLSSLPPSVEGRLAAWEQIQAGLQQPRAPEALPTITLSRQFGCEGFALAERLCAALGAAGERWTLLDHALIERVALEERLSLRLLRDLGNRSLALEGLGIVPRGEVPHDVAFRAVARVLLAAAQAGHAVIVGRGGALLCKGLSNCFHFRLVASLEHRVRSVMRRLDLPEPEAREIVRTRSAQRDAFIARNLGADVSDPLHYDAVFNGERHSHDDIALAIVAYLRSAWKGGGPAAGRDVGG